MTTSDSSCQEQESQEIRQTILIFFNKALLDKHSHRRDSSRLILTRLSRLLETKYIISYTLFHSLLFFSLLFRGEGEREIS